MSNVTGFAKYGIVSAIEMAERTISNILIHREKMVKRAEEKEAQAISSHREIMKRRLCYRLFGRKREISDKKVKADYYGDTSPIFHDYFWDTYKADGYGEESLKIAREVLLLAQSTGDRTIWLSASAIKAISP